MSIESPLDLAGLQAAGRVVARALEAMAAAAGVGVTTADLDAVAASVLQAAGARSAPQVTYGFPGCTCISVNEEIVHGIPGARALASGDVLKIDVTAELDGYVADAARTVLVGTPSPLALRLHASAKAALAAALDAARAGARVSVIGRAVEAQARKDGFGVIRELCGHGVGRTIHEDPEVPNYENRFSTDVLTDGLVIAIEPMFAATRTRAVMEADGWTVRTADRSLAVHEEHTVVIRTGAPPLVLTASS